jgi:hypothetical protein
LRRFFAHRDQYGIAYLAHILGENYYDEQTALRENSWEHNEGLRVFNLAFPIY